MSSTDGGRPWYDEIGLADGIEDDIHTVPVREYATVHEFDNGDVGFDTPDVGQWFRADCVVSLEAWR